MIIIQTCPKCGADLQDMMLASNPPIAQKLCTKCHWTWTAPRASDEIKRVPFDPDLITGLNSLKADLIMQKMSIDLMKEY